MRLWFLRSDSSEHHTVKLQWFTADGSKGDEVIFTICAKVRQVAQNYLRLSFVNLSCHDTQKKQRVVLLALRMKVSS